MQKMQGPQGPPPPPPGFMAPPPYSAVPPQAPPAGQQPTFIIVQNTVLGPEPQGMNCPYCHADIVTRVESGPTAMTHLAFIICFIFICWPCAPFVYCTDGCLARKHYCPNCNRFLGQNGC